MRTVMRTTKKQPRYLPGINEIAGYIVGTGSGTKRPRTDSFIVTETEKKRKKAKRSYASGQMAGFIKKGKKYRKTKRNKMTMKGVNLAKETGGVVNAKKVAYIGHGSVPVYTARRMLWRAIFKRLFEKMYGNSPSGLVGTEYNFLLNTNDTLTVRWTSPTAAIVATNYSAASLVDIETVVTWASDPSRPYNTATGSQGETTLIEVVFIPGNTHLASLTRIRLKDCQFQLSSKCTLKLQNRTINTAGATEADEVDNQPLSGYSYSGKGSGASWKGQPNNLNSVFYDDIFRINNSVGIMSFGADTTTDTGLQEPPLAGDFGGVKKFGKVRFNPGDLKTSVLTDDIKIDVNKFHRMTIGIAQGDVGVYPIGQFRFFALEKMIDVSGSADQPSIIVAYEHNMRILASIKEKYATNTIQVTEYS